MEKSPLLSLTKITTKSCNHNNHPLLMKLMMIKT